MSRAENRIIDRIDRRREQKATTQVRELRRLQIGEHARSSVGCSVRGYSDPAEQLVFAKAAVWKLREFIATLEDEPGAVSFFGSLAATPDSMLPNAIARARAEQEHSRIFTKAANDRGEA